LKGKSAAPATPVASASSAAPAKIAFFMVCVPAFLDWRYRAPDQAANGRPWSRETLTDSPLSEVKPAINHKTSRRMCLSCNN
jgi:hypothetical protein